MRQNIEEWTTKNVWKAAFKHATLLQIFKACLPQIFLGTSLNTLFHLNIVLPSIQQDLQTLPDWFKEESLEEGIKPFSSVTLSLDIWRSKYYHIKYRLIDKERQETW